MVSYRVKRVKGKYYLTERTYDRSSKKVIEKSLGPIDLIRQLLYEHRLKSKKSEWSRRRDLNPRPPAYKADSKAERQGGGFPSPSIHVDVLLLLDWEKWCVEEHGSSPETCETYRRYLEKPLDQSNRWSAKAYKLYLKWLCNEHGSQEACSQYRKVRVPKAGEDLKVPSLSEVRETLEKAGPFRQVYWVLLQSGLRLNEALKLLRDADRLECVEVNGFYRCMVGWKRGMKRALWAYLVQLPQKQHVTRYMVESYAKRHGLVMPKYIRKFVSTKMSELDIPDDVINFIQGRAPQSVLERSYASKLGKADKWYKVYAEWLHRELSIPP